MALREAAPSVWFVTPDLMLLWSQDNAEKQKLGGKGPMNRGKYRISGPKPRPSLATGGRGGIAEIFICTQLHEFK